MISFLPPYIQRKKVFLIFPPADVISLVYLVEIFATDKSNTAFTRKTRSSYDIIVMSSNLKTLVFNLFVCSLIYWFILPFSTVLLESNCITYAIIVCTICTFIKSFEITSTRRSEDRIIGSSKCTNVNVRVSLNYQVYSYYSTGVVPTRMANPLK